MVEVAGRVQLGHSGRADLLEQADRRDEPPGPVAVDQHHTVPPQLSFRFPDAGPLDEEVTRGRQLLRGGTTGHQVRLGRAGGGMRVLVVVVMLLDTTVDGAGLDHRTLLAGRLVGRCRGLRDGFGRNELLVARIHTVGGGTGPAAHQPVHLIR